MSALFLFLLLLLTLLEADDDFEEITTPDDVDAPYGTCDQTFRIGKNTVASSDSNRDYIYAYNIFPYIHDQDTSHFIDGYCAYECKLELPDTCFKIHMPQTYQHDEGLLAIDILERKFTRKWQSVMSPLSSNNYDIFFDFNMAYWVTSLDDYIEKWNTFNHKQTTDSTLEFFGIEWIHDVKDIDLEADDTLVDNKFYSLLIHSPQSQVIYEFISYTKPMDNNYMSVKWIHSNIPRVTFKSMNDPYPWNRQDNAYIVPVRKSRATTNLNLVYSFYMDILEADAIYYTPTYIMDDLGGNNVPTRAVTLVLPRSHIELQFIERAWQYTAGDFTLMQYESLLRETHDSIITSPFCGLDRWADNHYGYSSWTEEGLMERVLSKLDQYGLKYRIYKSSIEHTTEGSRQTLDEYNKTEAYMAFIFEPTGQTIQLGGDITNEEFTKQIPIWSAQWCYRKCLHSEKDGMVNPEHVYIDNEDYDIRKLNVLKTLDISEGNQNNFNIWIFVMLFVCGFFMYGIYYCIGLYRQNCKYTELQVIDACTPLIHE